MQSNLQTMVRDVVQEGEGLMKRKRFVFRAQSDMFFLCFDRTEDGVAERQPCEAKPKTQKQTGGREPHMVGEVISSKADEHCNNFLEAVIMAGARSKAQAAKTMRALARVWYDWSGASETGMAFKWSG